MSPIKPLTLLLTMPLITILVNTLTPLQSPYIHRHALTTPVTSILLIPLAMTPPLSSAYSSPRPSQFSPRPNNTFHNALNHAHRFGRLHVCNVFLIIKCFFLLMAANAKQFITFAITRFALGLSSTGILVSIYVLS